MAERIDELRRRVDQDPASIAFAQLADEYRRAGRLDDAVRIARAGLLRHPGYLSARVTLGRTLIDLGKLDDAEAELESVLKAAPGHLAATRGLAEITRRRGEQRGERRDALEDVLQPPASSGQWVEAGRIDTAGPGEAALPEDIEFQLRVEADTARGAFDLDGFLLDPIQLVASPGAEWDAPLDLLDLERSTPDGEVVRELEGWLRDVLKDRAARRQVAGR